MCHVFCQQATGGLLSGDRNLSERVRVVREEVLTVRLVPSQMLAKKEVVGGAAVFVAVDDDISVHWVGETDCSQMEIFIRGINLGVLDEPAKLPRHIVFPIVVRNDDVQCQGVRCTGLSSESSDGSGLKNVNIIAIKRPLDVLRRAKIGLNPLGDPGNI